MKLYLLPNSYTEEQLRDSEAIRTVLSGLGHAFTDKVDESELIVSLGGDGALLKAANAALEYDLPLIGINSGRLGHLCALRIEKIENFNEVLKKTKISNRTVLECSIEGKTYLALNDIIISKTNFGQTVDLDVSIRKVRDFKMRGDGLIISTPTGSTAYNISAGGPIIDRTSPVLAITPICAHNSDVYPLIINDDKQVLIKINHDKAEVYNDGVCCGIIDDELIVKRSDRKIKLIV